MLSQSMFLSLKYLSSPKTPPQSQSPISTLPVRQHPQNPSHCCCCCCRCSNQPTNQALPDPDHPPSHTRTGRDKDRTRAAPGQQQQRTTTKPAPSDDATRRRRRRRRWKRRRTDGALSGPRSTCLCARHGEGRGNCSPAGTTLHQRINDHPVCVYHLVSSVPRQASGEMLQLSPPEMRRGRFLAACLGMNETWKLAAGYYLPADARRH